MIWAINVVEFKENHMHIYMYAQLHKVKNLHDKSLHLLWLSLKGSMKACTLRGQRWDQIAVKIEGGCCGNPGRRCSFTLWFTG